MFEWIGFAVPPQNRDQPAITNGTRLSPQVRAGIARSWLRRRRHRENFFPKDIFAEPAWDMLLELYTAYYEKRVVTVSDLCIAASVPSATALRWIQKMEEQAWFVRVKDVEDGRRKFIQISDRAAAQLDTYFDTALL